MSQKRVLLEMGEMTIFNTEFPSVIYLNSRPQAAILEKGLLYGLLDAN